jgi:arylsulfatase A-like enzyme
MHVTDWFPTLLHLAGCQSMNNNGKPLDGVSQVRTLWTDVEEAARDEILHGMDPLTVTKLYDDPRKFVVLKDRQGSDKE